MAAFSWVELGDTGKDMKRFFWRVRFTIYGQRRCPIGWGNWWAFSAGHADEYGIDCKPENEARVGTHR